MKRHNLLTRKIFHKIHLNQIKSKKGFDRVKIFYNEKILKLKKGYFKNKICADLGCGSTGAGGLNLLNIGAKYCHLLDMQKHIKKPIRKNLKKHNKKFQIDIGNLEKLPYKKNFFDFILCQGAIHHAKNDLKCFKEIYRVLKPKSKALIQVHGEGGLINDLTMKLIRPKYKNDSNFKKVIDKLLNKKSTKYKQFLFKHYDKETRKIFNYFSKYLDDDLLLTIKDRILAPKYKTYTESFLRSYLQKLGFKKIYRIKKEVKFSNIRRIISPLYFQYDNEISKALYGDGIIHLMMEK